MDVERRIHHVAIESHIAALFKVKTFFRHQRRSISYVSSIYIQTSRQASVAHWRHGVCQSSVAFKPCTVFPVGRKINTDHGALFYRKQGIKEKRRRLLRNAVGLLHGKAVGKIHKAHHIACRLRCNDRRCVGNDVCHICAGLQCQTRIDIHYLHRTLCRSIEAYECLAIYVGPLGSAPAIDNLHIVGLHRKCETRVGEIAEIHASVDNKRIVVTCSNGETVETYYIIFDRNIHFTKAVIGSCHTQPDSR